MISPLLYPAKNLAFLRNPKSGVSSVLKTLDSASQSNSLNRLCFPKDFNQHIFFGISRNPYSRILSAYLDKISSQRNENAVWRDFCVRYNVNQGKQLNFENFLNILAEARGLIPSESHYNLQKNNLWSDYIRPAYIGRLENIEHVASFLRGFGIKFKAQMSHATGSRLHYKDRISVSEARLIEFIYEEDFEFFGYEKSLSSDYVPPEIYGPQEILCEHANATLNAYVMLERFENGPDDRTRLDEFRGLLARVKILVANRVNSEKLDSKSLIELAFLLKKFGFFKEGDDVANAAMYVSEIRFSSQSLELMARTAEIINN